jgi:hypothetical protein
MGNFLDCRRGGIPCAVVDAAELDFRAAEKLMSVPPNHFRSSQTIDSCNSSTVGHRACGFFAIVNVPRIKELLR